MEQHRVEKFHKKKVLVRLHNGKEHLGKICDVTHDKVHMEIATETSATTSINVSLDTIQHIVSKNHINFLTPRIALSKENDAAITRHIETIKGEQTFTLQTRKYKLQVNGSKHRDRWSSRDFEREVAKWLTTKKPLELCPFALAKVGKEQYLLGVDRGHQIHKITKKTDTVLV